jgi:hypothetical protein
VVVLIASKSVSLFWAQNNPSQHFAVEQKRRFGAFFVVLIFFAYLSLAAAELSYRSALFFFISTHGASHNHVNGYLLFLHPCFWCDVGVDALARSVAWRPCKNLL